MSERERELNSTDRDKAERIIELEAGVPFDCPSILAEFKDSVDVERLTKRFVTALSEVRRETWKAAIDAVNSMPTIISREGVKKGSDLNGWYSAQQGAVTALKNARDK
jgi:hypothetical protein